MAKKRFYSEMMRPLSNGTAENIRKEMSRYGSMMKQDWSAPALCPREVIQKEFPRVPSPFGDGPADLYSGVQGRMENARRMMRKIINPTK